MFMEIYSWGRYPRFESKVLVPRSNDEAVLEMRTADSLIPRGLGRSYGDSSLGATVMNTDNLTSFLHFDDASGIVSCQSGVSLDEILTVFVSGVGFCPLRRGHDLSQLVEQLLVTFMEKTIT